VERFRILAKFIQHYSKQLAAGVLHVRVAGISVYEFPEERFGFSVKSFAVKQERPNAEDLGVAGLEGQALLNTLPGILHSPIALEPGREA
jgi:hypothetical protein